MNMNNLKIIRATIDHSKDISDLMLSDLKNPDPRFPIDMIDNFRRHAREESIKEEFSNPKLIMFLAVDNNGIVGFIVGYDEGDSAMIHYISAKADKVRKLLFDRFVQECRSRNMGKITADSFEFMDNDSFFKSSGFALTKKENLTPELELLWYELILK